MPQQQIPYLKIEAALLLFDLRCESRGFAPNTLKFYHGRLRPFAGFCQESGLTHIHEITSSHIRQHLVELRRRGLSAWTVHGSARALRTFFRFLERDGLLAASPMATVDMPRLEKRILPTVSTGDIEALLHGGARPYADSCSSSIPVYASPNWLH